MNISQIYILAPVAVIITLGGIVGYIILHDIAARDAIDSEEKIRRAARTYELTTEDKNTRIANPSSVISGCSDDVKNGKNIQKCSAYIIFLQDRCTRHKW